MPCPPFAPAIYFEDADIDALVQAFSERVRHDQALRPALDRLVGNHWEQAEQVVTDFLQATLFMQRRPLVDADWLARAARELSLPGLHQLDEILLECALVALPLHSAAVIAEIGDALARLLGNVIALEGPAREEHLVSMYDRLRSGALMSRL